MKYLIQNRKELAISVGFFVMTIINLIRAIRSQEITQDLVAAVIYAFFGVLAWYYNMPTSEENCKHTGLMRQEKAEKKDDYIGETFFDETMGDFEEPDLPEEEGGEDDVE